ncbi:glycosyltransferase family 1 protein [Fodinicurvata sp. EGI_FJ10296]|uniref:glycosyltransferase family 4 protein n=1 Tax=Fodinicurvata sp. EGI_FJ10296 TaxID=3231908 RepID=UPI0034528AFA
MRIVIVTDAWHPQINGVVRTLETTRCCLVAEGHDVTIIAPDGFRTVGCPSYPEIRLSIATPSAVGRIIRSAGADAIHIATEGPLGWAAWRYCRRAGLTFTTSYHTAFPEYLSLRLPVRTAWLYAVLRRFHGAASNTMVATPTIEARLRKQGFANLVRWTRGVDVSLFRPIDTNDDALQPFAGLPRPIHLSVGRVAPEKSVEAFAALDLPGSRVVIGDGPSLPRFRSVFPSVHWLGARHGADLARHIAAADVFVFPSRTDTFGLVMLEALACGVPVAANPVPGPLDLIGPDGQGVGALDTDLKTAIARALTADRTRCRRFAEALSWERATQQFVGNLRPAPVLANAA